MLTGCGSAPLHPYVLKAPSGVDRWEPSGAAVVDQTLWVVNDRKGWLAGYRLPLELGANRPTIAHRLRPALKRVKWEGAAPDGAGGIWLLEAYSRAIFHCPNPTDGCPELVRESLPGINAEIDRRLPGPVEYVVLEGLAVDGDVIRIGTRGYVPKGSPTYVFHPWPLVFLRGGGVAFDGAPWRREGRDYGISAMASDGDTLWMTYSYEDELDHTRRGVAGLLVRAAVDSKTGRVAHPVLCRTLVGKPEGLAVMGERLVVIFDNDLGRKSVSDPERFGIDRAEDFARVIEKSSCARARPGG